MVRVVAGCVCVYPSPRICGEKENDESRKKAREQEDTCYIKEDGSTDG